MMYLRFMRNVQQDPKCAGSVLVRAWKLHKALLSNPSQAYITTVGVWQVCVIRPFYYPAAGLLNPCFLKHRIQSVVPRMNHLRGLNVVSASLQLKHHRFMIFLQALEECDAMLGDGA